jgi:hypothetical protein
VKTGGAHGIRNKKNPVFTKAGHIPNAKVIHKKENDVGLGRGRGEMEKQTAYQTY